MTEEPKKYAAFISYRHVMPDMAIAQKLHKMLEHNQVRPGRHAPRNIRPVFLDTGELPIQENLDESILRALDNSECLFVICSPELPKSKYCLREIEYFKKIHGGRVYKIYTLLAAGTPEESFPEILRTEERIIQDEHGHPISVQHEIEPLFADIRGSSLRQSLKKLYRTEYLRLAAAYYGCSYDSLYKRRIRWRIKVGAGIAALAMMILSAFGVYAHIRNLQYDAARAVTYASYAEAETAAGDELLAMALCEEGWESAQRSRSERYTAALRSAIVQHEFEMRARPVRLTMSAESESTVEPIFYLNNDGTLAMSLTNHLFQIIDAKTGAILQQFPADSIAVDPDDMSVYVCVEAVQDENGRYQDTMFLRAPDGRLLGSFPFRESTIYTPRYKMVSERYVPDLLGLQDNNELVIQFTRQGKILTEEEAEELRQNPVEPKKETEAPFYVKNASVLSKRMQVKDRNGQIVLELDSKTGLTDFSGDYSRFCFVKDGVMQIYETEEWSLISEMMLPEGLLQQVYLLRDTGYALCIYHTMDNFSRTVLVDWRIQETLLEADGYAYPDEEHSCFYCMESGRVARYSYNDMNVQAKAEVAAMHGSRILCRQGEEIFLRDCTDGRTLWQDRVSWTRDISHSSELARTLIPGEDALRCWDETGRLLWQADIENALAALSEDGSLAVYRDAAGNLSVVSGENGAVQYTIPAGAFEQVDYPTGVCVSERGVAVLNGEQGVWIPCGKETGCMLGAYTGASEAEGYLILTNEFAYVMDFAIWNTESRSIVWQPEENTGLWAWSENSGYLVRHKEISGNRGTAELALHRLTGNGMEEVGVLPLPDRNVHALRMDSTGRWLSVRAGASTLLYDLETMNRVMEVTGCPVFYEDGRLWDWVSYDGALFNTAMPDEHDLHDRMMEALTSGYGTRTLSPDEMGRYSFSK